MKVISAIILTAVVLVEFVSAQALHRHRLVKVRRQSIIGISQIPASGTSSSSLTATTPILENAAQAANRGNGVELVSSGSFNSASVTSSSSSSGIVFTPVLTSTTSSSTATTTASDILFTSSQANATSTIDQAGVQDALSTAASTTATHKNKGSNNDRSTTVGDDGVETVFILQTSPISTVTRTTVINQAKVTKTRKANKSHKTATKTSTDLLTTSQPTRLARRRI